MRVVVIGGVAAGPKAASRILRVQPDARVTLFEQGRFLSYAGCGLPYYVSGTVREQRQLMETPVGVLRDPAFFANVKHFQVRDRTRVTAIDRAARTVSYESLEGGESGTAEYDRLVFATGARPVRPPIPGIDLEHVHCLHGIEDSEGIRRMVTDGQARDVVIIGGGLIGVEVTEALASAGCRVTIVERLPQILSVMDWELALQIQRHLQSKGVKVLTGANVEAIVPAADGPRVAAVRTDQGEVPAELVIAAVGVRPATELAREAGLAIDEATGALAVDERMGTSDPDIFAAGDCVVTPHQLTGRPYYAPLGSLANKQARVAANNVCGLEDRFPGVLATVICRVFDLNAGRTGLGEAEAREAGFDVETVLAPGPDAPHFMPESRPIILKLMVDRPSGRLLGLEAVGPGRVDKRIDVAATAITAGMTVDQVAKLDLAYAPPYSSAMDNLITACDVARNKLSGLMEGVSPMALERERRERGEDLFLLDVRSPKEVEEVAIPGAVNIPLGALTGRLDEVPRDKDIVCFCKISLRGYEAARVLTGAGYPRVRVMDGGILTWPYEKRAAASGGA
jgi:NADPH-dependent 2,4-dienoyl-CoA reductase/sulfur reductase-like enzyme/rhodanese-related sulfurtransferase